MNIDYNTLLRRAEHEVGYSAKRAIEMYIDVFEKGPGMFLFEGPISKHYGLCVGEIEKCVLLMREFGMS